MARQADVAGVGQLALLVKLVKVVLPLVAIVRDMPVVESVRVTELAPTEVIWPDVERVA